VIRTASRFRVPKTLSYPIGAEALSTALESVPLPNELSVCFYFDGRGNAIFEAAHRGEALSLLEATYTPARADIIGAHATGSPEWRLWVKPVPSAHRSSSRRSLIDTGLGRVGRWLSQSRPSTWRSERHSLLVQIRLPEAAIDFVES
jgi:hypothetical protein